MINADPREIVWTSGATESINLALKGAAEFYKTKGKHLVTVKTEHKAVLDSMHALERHGWSVTVLPVWRDGRLDPEEIENRLQSRVPGLGFGALEIRLRQQLVLRQAPVALGFPFRELRRDVLEYQKRGVLAVDMEDPVRELV